MRSILLFGASLLAACGGGATSDPLPVSPTPVLFQDARVLVSLSEPEDEDEVDELLEEFEGLTIERIGSTSFFILTIPAGQDPVRFVAALDDDLRVVSSELDYIARAPVGGPSGSATLGSELIDQIASQGALGPLDLAAAHAVTRGAGSLVAVVDTGIDPDHPLLAGRIASGGRDFIDNDEDPRDERNFVDDDGDGQVDGAYGHGTFIASLVLTVAPEAQILPIRVLDDEGFGSSSTVAAGIVWAIDQGADVVNFSIDMTVESEVLKNAIEYAKERDVVIVASAGNAGLTELRFPARFDEVVAIAAVGPQGVLAPFSNVGSKVSFVAPGIDLLGAVPMDLNPVGTAHWSGTSFAAPFVSGSVALVRAAYPGDDARELVRRLTDSAQSVASANPNHGGRLGAGLVQPAAALTR